MVNLRRSWSWPAGVGNGGEYPGKSHERGNEGEAIQRG